MEDGLYGKSRRGCCFRFAPGSLVKGEGDRHEVVFEGTVKNYVTLWFKFPTYKRDLSLLPLGVLKNKLIVCF